MKKKFGVKRIGILGGTFDPVHKAHLALARAAKKKLRLTQIIFVPAFISPFKIHADISSAADRLSMLKLSLKKIKWAVLSHYEIRKKKISYTIDTIKHLKKRTGKRAKFFLILGVDALRNFHRWKEADQILKRVRLAVAGRPAFRRERVYRVPYEPIPMAEYPISSTQIREEIKRGNLAKVKKEVPLDVFRYIQRRNLYYESPQLSNK